MSYPQGIIHKKGHPVKAANDPTEILDRLPEPYRTMVLALPADADPDRQGFPTAARVVLRSRGDLSPSFCIEVQQTDGMGDPTWYALPNFDRMARSVDGNEVMEQALARHGLVVLALAERVAELEDELAKGDA